MLGCAGTGLTYQWQRGGTNIDGATDASYTTPPATMEDDGATYQCVVRSSSGGNRTSNAAKLTVGLFTLPFVLDDFSDGDRRNNLGFWWYYYDDNAGVGPNDRPQSAPTLQPSVINVSFYEKERHAFGDVEDIWKVKIYTQFLIGEVSGNKCASMPFTFGDSWAASFCKGGNPCALPYVGIAIVIIPLSDTVVTHTVPPMSSCDLTGVTLVRFSIKSRVNTFPKVTFKIQTFDIDVYASKPGSQMKGDEFGYYSYSFSVSPGAWQQKSIRIADLALPGTWAHNFTFDITKCATLAWEIPAQDLDHLTDTLDIDNVRFE